MSVLDRFISSIRKHPYRSTVSALLMLIFLGLLLPATLPFTLPTFFSPIATWLQMTLLTRGAWWGAVLANTLVGMTGTILAYYIPKLAGNILQFVGKRLIEGILGALSTIPYLFVREAGDIIEPCLPEKSDESVTECDDDRLRNILVWPGLFIKYALLGFAWLVTQIGKSVNTLGHFISGEYHLIPAEAAKMKQNKQNGSGKDSKKISKNQSEEEHSYKESDALVRCCQSSCARISSQLDVIADVYHNPNNAEKTTDEDPAILFPDASQLVSAFWTEKLNSLGSTIPLKTYDTMREQEIEDAKDNNNRSYVKNYASSL